MPNTTPRAWTGPQPGDYNPVNAALRFHLSDDRWPYGSRERHQPGCLLCKGGLLCTCKLSQSADAKFSTVVPNPVLSPQPPHSDSEELGFGF